MHFHVRQVGRKYTLQQYSEEAVMVKRKRQKRRKTLQLESKKCKKDFKSVRRDEVEDSSAEEIRLI